MIVFSDMKSVYKKIQIYNYGTNLDKMLGQSGASCHMGRVVTASFFPTLTNCLETIFVVITSFPAIFILSFCLQKNHASSVLN